MAPAGRAGTPAPAPVTGIVPPVRVTISASNEEGGGAKERGATSEAATPRSSIAAMREVTGTARATSTARPTELNTRAPASALAAHAEDVTAQPEAYNVAKQTGSLCTVNTKGRGFNAAALAITAANTAAYSIGTCSINAPVYTTAMSIEHLTTAFKRFGVLGDGTRDNPVCISDDGAGGGTRDNPICISDDEAGDGTRDNPICISDDEAAPQPKGVRPRCRASDAPQTTAFLRQLAANKCIIMSKSDRGTETLLRRKGTTAVPLVDFVIRRSEGKGLGIFAEKDIEMSTLITRYEGVVVCTNSSDTVVKEHCKRVQNTDYAIDGGSISARVTQLEEEGAGSPRYPEFKALVEAGVGCMVNSSRPESEPNCSFCFFSDSTCWVYALRDLKKGEELLCDYNYVAK